jgi:hypothetical protein
LQSPFFNEKFKHGNKGKGAIKKKECYKKHPPDFLDWLEVHARLFPEHFVNGVFVLLGFSSFCAERKKIALITLAKLNESLSNQSINQSINQSNNSINISSNLTFSKPS